MDPGIPALPQKEFFTMGEACRIAQVPAHTLRYWESRVKLLRPARRSSGHRRYGRADIETIFLIKELIWRRKMTVEGARKAILERQRGVKITEPAAQDAKSVPATTLKLLREVRREIQLLVNELK